MTLKQYGRYLFLLQYHLRDVHDGKQCLVDGRSQFIIDEQLSYPICTACNTLITPRSIGMKMTEKTMERRASWQLDRRASAGQNQYAVEALAKTPQEIRWHHDYDARGELVCIDPHYADVRAHQLHGTFELERPSAQYPTEPPPEEELHIFSRQRNEDGSWGAWSRREQPVRSFDPLPENREDTLWVISITVNGVDADKIDTPLPPRTPVQVCVSDGMQYTVPLGTRMYLSDGSVLLVQTTMSGQVKAFIQSQENA